MADYTRELRIAEILARQEAGELPEEDREYLDRWLEESDEHAGCYTDLLQHPGRAGSLPDFDTERFVRKTIRKIRRRRIHRLTWYAASVAAVLSIGIFSALFFQQPIPSVKHRPDRSVMAGRPQAVLSLPGGQHVNLGNGEGQDTAWMKYAGAHRKKGEAVAEPAEMKIEVARGGEYRICLDDGTVVWLNSESSLVYPEQFTGDKRMVRLSGEGYFEVARNEKKPFIVSVAGMEIKVLGTMFNVTAYQDEHRVTTTLVSGAVEVATPHRSVQLQPGRQAVVQEGKEDIEVSEVDVELYASWRAGIFKFDKMTLTDICTRLSRWYDVDFVFEGECGQERFTGGTWKYVPLKDFLSKIERVTDVSFQFGNNKVKVISKK